MVYEIILFPRAEIALEKAYLWYESRQSGLGERFITGFENEIKRIEKNPQQHKIRSRDFREVPMKSFPYVIIYRIVDKQILIQSVFNTHQNPTRKP